MCRLVAVRLATIPTAKQSKQTWLQLQDMHMHRKKVQKKTQKRRKGKGRADALPCPELSWAGPGRFDDWTATTRTMILLKHALVRLCFSAITAHILRVIVDISTLSFFSPVFCFFAFQSLCSSTWRSVYRTLCSASCLLYLPVVSLDGLIALLYMCVFESV